MLKECDAVLAVNAHALEKPAIDVMKSWFSEWSKDLYAIGPLLPSGHGNVLQSNRGYEDITEFLSKHGPNSVILVSFRFQNIVCFSHVIFLQKDIFWYNVLAQGYNLPGGSGGGIHREEISFRMFLLYGRTSRTKWISSRFSVTLLRLQSSRIHSKKKSKRLASDILRLGVHSSTY